MPDRTALLSHFYVKLNGSDAPQDFMLDLLEVTVESSLHLPDVATLVLHDTKLKWVDDASLAPGKTVEVIAKIGQQEAPVFDGEIVELEPKFEPSAQSLVVRAFDRLHRLARGRQARSFQGVTDGDLVNKLAGEAGLSAQCGPTTQVFDYVFQANETNLEFLQKRAVRLGYLLFVRNKVLHFEKPQSAGGAIDLKWSENLREFQPRMTTVDQVTDVTVRGWDPEQKQPIVGQAQNGQGTPQTGLGTNGGQTAQSAFSLSAPHLVTDRPFYNQGEADRRAQAEANLRASRFVEAEGKCDGNPKVVAGASVNVSGIGTRFSGTYFVTSAIHNFASAQGYSTQFSVSGLHQTTLISLMAPEQEAVPTAGLVIGVVTDNQDPKDWGRVKVKYPWLTNDHASDWARLVTPGGGPDRGVEFLPEVNDEVVVGFEQSDVHHPFVLGGLWNGKDAPPKKSSQAISGGNVQQRIIKSRSGHIVTLDDTSGSEQISIVDKTGNNKIVIQSSNNSMQINVDGDLTIESKGKVTIKGQTGIEVASQADLKMSASTSADLKANSQLNLEGTAGATLKNAAAQVALSGPSVSLNNGALEVM